MKTEFGRLPKRSSRRLFYSGGTLYSGGTQLFGVFTLIVIFFAAAGNGFSFAADEPDAQNGVLTEEKTESEPESASENSEEKSDKKSEKADEKPVEPSVEVTVTGKWRRSSGTVEAEATGGVGKNGEEADPEIAAQEGTGENKTGENKNERIIGRLLADYRSGQGGGLVSIQRPDGAIETIPGSSIAALEKNGPPFVPMSRQELGRTLQAEGGPGFAIESSPHFLVAYNTSKAYAQWCVRLFESLYDTFDRYQKRRGWELPESEFPMIVLLFSNRGQFADYARRDMPDPRGIAAYYNRLSNRIVLYDLSEEETAASGSGRRLTNFRQIDEFLARPQAAFNVATIIHEATHQIAFNRGMFLRTEPYPLWLVEGLSMFFESPDSRATKGWNGRKSVSRPNRLRLDHLRAYLATGPSDPIRDLIREEKFNQQPIPSYAVSWGLYYYLNAKEPKKLSEYVRIISKKQPYTVYSPEDRLADFERIFGSDWDQFHRDFGRFIDSIK